MELWDISQIDFSSHMKHTFRPVGNDQLFQIASPFGKTLLLVDWKAQLLTVKKKKKLRKRRNSTDNEPTSTTAKHEFLSDKLSQSLPGRKSPSLPVKGFGISVCS